MNLQAACLLLRWSETNRQTHVTQYVCLHCSNNIAKEALHVSQEVRQPIMWGSGRLDSRVQLHSKHVKSAWHDDMSNALLHRVV